MGTAYRAWDNARGVPVVIKMPQAQVLRNPAARERFRREVRIMAAFRHPDIVPVIEDGSDDRLGPYVALQLLPGGCLHDRHARSADGVRKPMAPHTLRSWLPAVARALDHLHSKRVAHRDVKPTNIFFDAQSKAYLGDFGIAKVLADSDQLQLESGLTVGIAPGTLPYMPPEAFTSGSIDPTKGDQYALGMCVYEWLNGRLPFAGDAAKVMQQILTGDIPPLIRCRPNFPLATSLAVSHALRSDPNDRFSSCEQFSETVLSTVGPLEQKSGEYILLCPACTKLIRVFHGLSGLTCRCPECQARLRVSSNFDALWHASEASPAGRPTAECEDHESTEYETAASSMDSVLHPKEKRRLGRNKHGANAVFWLAVGAAVGLMLFWRLIF